MAEGLLNQYREKLKKAIGTARFYGLPDRPLEKVFVELTVIEDFEIPRDAEYKALMDKELRRRRTLFPKDETEEDEENDPEETDEEGRERPRKVRRTVKPEELLEAGKRSQVVGAPGCGKTTLLRWLALQTAQTSNRLPVFIELKALRKAQFDTIDDDFSVFLFQQGVRKRFDRTDLTVKQFTALETVFCEYYKAGGLVVLLDGLDEIAESERHRLRTAVENYSNHHEGGLTLIVSTRPYGYLRNFADLKAMEIEPLSDIQIGQFLDHWCEKQTAENVKASLRKNPNLRGLARFPFLLAFIAHLKSGGDIPRTELYQQIVSELVTKLDKDKGVERFKIDDQSGTLKRSFLRQLSFERLLEGQTTDLTPRLVFSFEELVEQAESFLKKKNRHFPPEDLAFDVCATPLLREVENERYTFAHLTIQEFLAAEELSKRDNCDKLFIQAFFNRQLAEMEVLPMTIGLAKNPNEFYHLLSKLPESFDFMRLCLEGRSLGYHQKAIGDEFYHQWQMRLTDFGLRGIWGEQKFSNMVLSSFVGIEISHQPKLNSGFLSALHDQDSTVRQHAADAFGKLGYSSPDAIRNLSDALRDQDSWVRQRAAVALGKLGYASPDAVRNLSDALYDQDVWVRQRAADALVKLGYASPNAVRVLSDSLGDQDWPVRQNAAKALGKLGNASPDVVRALSEALRDQNRSVRQSAANSLGKLGNASPDVVHALSEALRDQNRSVRQSAANSLRKLDNPTLDVGRALSEELRDQNRSVRQNTAQPPKKLSVTLDNFTNLLSAALGFSAGLGFDENPEVSQTAAQELERMGFDSTEFCEGLTLLLGGHDEKLLKIALRSIGYLSTDPGLLDDLKILTEWNDPTSTIHFIGSPFFESIDPVLLDYAQERRNSDELEIREAAEDAYNKYKFKLEMLGLLPA